MVEANPIDRLIQAVGQSDVETALVAVRDINYAVCDSIDEDFLNPDTTLGSMYAPEQIRKALKDFIEGGRVTSKAIYMADGGLSRLGLSYIRDGQEIRVAVGLYLEPNQRTLDRWNELNSKSQLNKNPNPKITHEPY